MIWIFIVHLAVRQLLLLNRLVFWLWSLPIPGRPGLTRPCLRLIGLLARLVKYEKDLIDRQTEDSQE